ncbi:MAG: RnfABCDGE type electron transport complex subunit G [Chromatiaceae bacterium]|nr:MAG: RnfABCDGE type electron transport complex subunit G [Chromatiaceae bacterium]
MNSPATALLGRSRDGVVYQAALLGSFALLAASLLVLGNLLTRDAIRERAAEDLRASLTQVIPARLHDNDLLANPLVLPLQDSAGAPAPLTVYRALQGLDVTAVAFMVTGTGYAGPIRIMLGVDAHGRVLGARVLAHQETPGLGDKIEVARDE